MDISILIGIGTAYRQTGWTVGDCPECERLEALRVDDAFQRVSIWGVPVVHARQGSVTRCACCESPGERLEGASEVPIAAWTAEDGLESLVSRCTGSRDWVIPEFTDDDYHRLLATVRRVTSVNSLDISFGLTSGLILGLACGGLAGWFYTWKSTLFGLDSIGTGFVFVLTGLVVGAVAGAMLQAWQKGHGLARAKLVAASRQYHLSMARMLELARFHGRRVRRAVDAEYAQHPSRL